MIIGLTGGVGSGKSTVLGLLKEHYNAYIIEADKIAHELMLPGHDCYNEIIREFGKDILTDDKVVDRKLLGKIVFKDQKKLAVLNGIIHPAVNKEINRQIKEVESKEPERVIVIEAALLIEAGDKEIYDKFWYVHTEYPIRKQRLIESRGYTESKIKEIMGNQLTDEEFKQMCDVVIDNSADIGQTLLQIEKILEF